MNIYFTLPPKVYNILQWFVHGDYKDTGDLLRATYEPFRGSPALDLGCGTGILAKFFAPEEYVGCDLDEERIKTAQLKFPGFEFFVADATDLNPDFTGRFPFIFAQNWLHHVDNKCIVRTLERILDGSKKAGRPIEMLVIEPLLPCCKFSNPFGYLLAKLDRGRFVRSDKEMRSLLGRYLKDARIITGPWYWPVPSGVYRLKIEP